MRHVASGRRVSGYTLLLKKAPLVFCNVLQCVAVCFSVLWCVAECCCVLQYVAECCRVLQCVAECCSGLQSGVVCCSVLHCVVVSCDMLQCVPCWSAFSRAKRHVRDEHQRVAHGVHRATSSHSPTLHILHPVLQYVKVRCSMLQRVAVRCCP